MPSSRRLHILLESRKVDDLLDMLVAVKIWLARNAYRPDLEIFAGG